MKRFVRSCRFSTSYITENQQITLHLKTANSCRQQEEQKYKSLFHHYIVSLNYAIAKVQKLLQQHTILYLKITKNQHCSLSPSNPQQSPSTSFLRVHVLSLLNYQINWGRSTHFCLQYPLTPQCDLRQYAVSYPQVVGVIQKQSGIHLCKHYYRYRYSAHTALMSWSTWLVQRQTWRQTLLSQNLKTEP